MKAKISLFGLFILLTLLTPGCQKDDPDPAFTPDAKLKQVILYSAIDSKEPISIVEEYEYDDDGRISKVSSPMYDNGTVAGIIRYDLYEYNSSGQLIRINNYNANLNSPTGFINLKNRSFDYASDGKKIKETIDYPLGGISEYLYSEYKNGLLSKTDKYSGNKLESYTEYEYDKSGRVIKELFYAHDGQCLTYTNHSYTGSLQVKSDLYTFPSNSHYRSVNRIFDKNNNIVTLESKELSPYSSLMSHVLRYEYYE